MAIGSFPVHNPVLRQIRPEHISKVLDNQAKIADHERQDGAEARRWGAGLAAFLAVLGVTTLLILSLSGHSDDLQLVLQYALPFIGGLGGGFLLAEYRHRKS